MQRGAPARFCLAAELLRQESEELLLRPFRGVRVVFQHHAHDAPAAAECGIVKAMAGAEIDEEPDIGPVYRQPRAVRRTRHAVCGAEENERRDREPPPLDVRTGRMEGRDGLEPKAVGNEVAG